MAKLLNVKNDFPVLVNNPNLSYLDTGATALKPYQVINKLDEYYKEYEEKYLALRKYCRLDTWSMVKILQGLKNLI